MCSDTVTSSAPTSVTVGTADNSQPPDEFDIAGLAKVLQPEETDEVSMMRRSAKAWIPKRLRRSDSCDSMGSTASGLSRADSAASTDASTTDSPVNRQASTDSSSLLFRSARAWVPRHARLAASRECVAAEITELDSADSDSVNSITQESIVSDGIISSARTRRVCVNYLDDPGRVEVFNVVPFDYSSVGDDWVSMGERRSQLMRVLRQLRRARCRGSFPSNTVQKMSTENSTALSTDFAPATRHPEIRCKQHQKTNEVAGFVCCRGEQSQRKQSHGK